MNFTIEIASVQDRDSVVAEIWLADEMLAEIHRVDRDLLLEIYPSQSGVPWSFNLQDWLSTLSEAQRRLG